jgi:hypothetical protein
MVTSLELLMILIPNIYLRFQEEEMALDSLKITNTVSFGHYLVVGTLLMKNS